jgi:hypothetical protein
MRTRCWCIGVPHWGGVGIARSNFIPNFTARNFYCVRYCGAKSGKGKKMKGNPLQFGGIISKIDTHVNGVSDMQNRGGIIYETEKKSGQYVDGACDAE